MRGYNNYDKRPATHVDGTVAVGWKAIVDVLCREWGDRHVWAIDLYVGSYSNDFIEALATTGRRIIDVRQLMLPERVIRTMTHRFVTDDVLFGYMSNLRMEDFFDAGISSASDGDDCIVDINKAKAKGKFPKDKKKIVEAWAIIHQKELFECWDLLCKENKVMEIEPLK